MHAESRLVALLTRWPARLTLPVLIISVCAGLLLMLFHLRSEQALLAARTRVSDELAELVGQTARRLDSYAELGDTTGARGMVTRLALYTAVTEAWLLDAEGRVLASLRRSDSARSFELVRRRLLPAARALLEPLDDLPLIDPLARSSGAWRLQVEPALISSAPPVFGRLVVLADAHDAEDQARWQMREVFRSEALVLILSSVLIWWLLRLLLLERSARLQAAAESLHGGAALRLSGVDGRDELGAIGRALDAGLARLRRHEAIQHLTVHASLALAQPEPLPQRLHAVLVLLAACPAFRAARLLTAASPGQPVLSAGSLPSDTDSVASRRFALPAGQPDDPAWLEVWPWSYAAADPEWNAALELVAREIQAQIARLQSELARHGAERRERLALEAAELGAWQLDLAPPRLRLSPRAARMLGVEPLGEGWLVAEAEGDSVEMELEALPTLLSRLHPEDAQRFEAMLKRDEACPSLLDEEFRVRRGAAQAWLLGRGTVVERDPQGKATALAGVLIDIDARRRAESALRLASEVFEKSQLGILICDAEDRIIDVNNAFAAITGYAREEVLGRSPSVLSSGRHSPAFYQQMWQELSEHGRWQGEVWNRRRSGEIYPQWLTITRVDDAQGRPLHYIGQFVDTSDRKAIESRIEYLGAHDLLTGLPRRERLMEALAAELSGNAPSVALMHVDIDRFRQINESLGYEAGDALLRSLSERIASALPPEAWISRISADEFLVLVHAEDADDAKQRAECLHARLCQPIPVAGQELVLGLSIGLALGPRDAGDAEGLAAAAERALTAAQQAGRNGVQAYSPLLHGHSLEALTLESQLRLALSRDEFFVVYQPQVDLASGALAGFEALVRWRHPERGLVSPAQFIGLAERTGLIVPIGHFVLREACAAAMRLRARGLPHVPISVNVSALQFRREDFEASVQAALAATGLPASALELELTESVLMDRADDTLLRLDRLRSVGLKLAIDDFGTGFSSLAYLGRLKPDRLKIDQSFVRGMGSSATTQGIVKAILALAEELHLSTVAEGVETAEEAAVLRALGCDTGQGYLYARPLEEAQIRWPLEPAG